MLSGSLEEGWMGVREGRTMRGGKGRGKGNKESERRMGMGEESGIYKSDTREEGKAE